MDNTLEQLKTAIDTLYDKWLAYEDSAKTIQTYFSNIQSCYGDLTDLHRQQLLDLYNTLGTMIVESRSFNSKKTNYAIKLKDIEMSVRLRNILKASHIETLGDLCSLSGTGFLRVRNCGKRSYYEAYDILDKHGLHFSDNSWTKIQGYEFRLNWRGEYDRKMLTETNDEV